MRKERPIPEPSAELMAQCDADDQLSNFERVFRAVMSVPKEKVLKQEAENMHRNVLKRARKGKA